MEKMFSMEVNYFSVVYSIVHPMVIFKGSMKIK